MDSKGNTRNIVVTAKLVLQPGQVVSIEALASVNGNEPTDPLTGTFQIN